jgi:hypothetical protein
MSTTVATIDERLATWSRAELAGDAAALDALLHPDFVGVGPFGFVLSRDQWLRRFADGLHYTQFDFTRDGEPRFVGGCAIAVGRQHQAGKYQQQPADGDFRTTLVFTGDASPQLVHLQVSLGSPPGAPRPAGDAS